MRYKKKKELSCNTSLLRTLAWPVKKTSRKKELRKYSLKECLISIKEK